MDILRTVADLRKWRGARDSDVGLVPTMGFLHEGHLSLAREARRNHLSVIATIFVNPAQFAPHEDLDRYPRDEPRDLALLEGESVDAVFVPAAAEMYPAGFSTFVTVEGLTGRLEGSSRPTHFRGVTTVVLKLLNLVQPRASYFGQKDAQQLAVIRKMARDLDLPVAIVGMPIVREPDGLAMSSRNAYLSPEQRAAATVLFRALTCAERLHRDGVRDAPRIKAAIETTIGAEPLASIDYVSIADAGTLDELDSIDGPALVSLAVRFGATRLIDNITLDG